MLKLWRPFKSYVLTCNVLISLSVHLLCAFANSAKNATSLDLPLRGGGLHPIEGVEVSRC